MKKLALFVVPLLLLSLEAAVPAGIASSTSRADVAFLIPSRPQGAPTGSEFFRQTAGLNRVEREQAILAQLEIGNVPRFLRQLRRLELRSKTPSGPGAGSVSPCHRGRSLGIMSGDGRMNSSPILESWLAPKPYLL